MIAEGQLPTLVADPKLSIPAVQRTPPSDSIRSLDFSSSDSFEFHQIGWKAPQVRKFFKISKFDPAGSFLPVQSHPMRLYP